MGPDADGGSAPTLEQNLGLDPAPSTGKSGEDSLRLKAADNWGDGDSDADSNNENGADDKANEQGEAGDGEESGTEVEQSEEGAEPGAEGEGQDGATGEAAEYLTDLRAMIDAFDPTAGNAPADPKGPEAGAGANQPPKLPDLGKLENIFDDATIDAINKEAGEPEGSSFGKAVAKAANIAVQKVIGNIVPHIEALGGAIGPIYQEHQARERSEAENTLKEVVGFFDDLAGAGFEKLIGKGEKIRPAALELREEICMDAAKLRAMDEKRKKPFKPWRKYLSMAAATHDKIGEKALGLGKAKAGGSAAGQGDGSKGGNGAGGGGVSKTPNQIAHEKRFANRSFSTSGRGMARTTKPGMDPRAKAASNWDD